MYSVGSGMVLAIGDLVGATVATLPALQCHAARRHGNQFARVGRYGRSSSKLP